MDNNKNFWQKFNPSLKEMMEKRPNFTILGLWWAWYWRLIVLFVVIILGIAIIAKIFS